MSAEKVFSNIGATIDLFGNNLVSIVNKIADYISNIIIKIGEYLISSQK